MGNVIQMGLSRSNLVRIRGVKESVPFAPISVVEIARARGIKFVPATINDLDTR